MPLFSLYISSIITTSMRILSLIFAMAPFTNRSLTRTLYQKQNQFKLRVPYQQSFWAILPLLLVSLFTTTSEPAVSLSLQTATVLPASEHMYHSISARYLMVLPFTQSPLVPVFQPVAGYPKKLCIFSNVQLDPQFVSIIADHLTHNIPAFPFWDLLISSGHLLQNAVVNLHPSWKPPYHLSNFDGHKCNSPMLDFEK
jgi:hypothetical protein